MNSYRIERPVKWEGEIRKSGSLEATADDAAPLIKSGALVLISETTNDNVPPSVSDDGTAGSDVPDQQAPQAGEAGQEEPPTPETPPEEPVSDAVQIGFATVNGESVPLEDLLVKDLEAIAKDKEIDGYYKLLKADLVEAIKAEQAKVSA
ncbi:Rho termination factor N-terminal domain-containing protein [Marinobacterium litorale]|uniref:Rho termination factor N-terminal domain-containing protein n=1 Tax=Marinobacterium litorale TaxID=404770 RepID=UPI00041D9C59|nr:Rho termination factor N-terminal domain-containing protein [Marinobacterium litorale]